MTDRTIICRNGDQVYVEYEDFYGNVIQEWEWDPIRMCACGLKPATECTEVQVTTFTETYSCGYVYRYANRHGDADNLISVNGKRVDR